MRIDREMNCAWMLQYDNSFKSCDVLPSDMNGDPTWLGATAISEAINISKGPQILTDV